MRCWSRNLYAKPETPDESEGITFGEFVNDFVAGLKARDKRIKENAEIFQKKYGIKSCPFHTPAPAEEVKPNFDIINFYGTNYKFTYTKCATWNLCHSDISFDKGLIKKIKENEKLIEVQTRDSTKCVTCGNDEGKAYLTGFYISIGGSKEFRNSKAVKLKPGFRGFWDREKLYLFERPCHTYLVANFGGVDLKSKKPIEPPFNIKNFIITN
ncbi:MAG: hypothetical protein ABIF18_03425 [archaeon]